jgi:hypothetical protein
MSFIGNVPAEAYSPVAKDTFSGNDSTTDFTLSIPATTNSVEVFVENVQQEPTTAYTISGTTLSFTAAPVTGTNNIYVIHRGPAVQQIVPPAGVALNPSDVTATGNLSVAGTTTLTDDLNIDSGTLFVDASTNKVGIGTSSPAADLDIERATGTVELQLQSRDASNTFISFGDNDDGDVGQIKYAHSDNSMRFTTNAAERARIDSSGGLIIGHTSEPDGNQNAVYLFGDLGKRYFSRNSTLARDQLAFLNPNGAVGSITTTGSATAFNTSSDYRLKENVVDMTDAIDRVKALPVRRFNFIADPDKTVDGFLAHEAQEIVPEAVTGEKDEVEAIGNVTDAEGVVVQENVTEPTELPEGQVWTKTGDRPVMQGIDQAKLVPLLTGALKETIARIETLEAEVATLKGASA